MRKKGLDMGSLPRRHRRVLRSGWRVCRDHGYTVEELHGYEEWKLWW